MLITQGDMKLRDKEWVNKINPGVVLIQNKIILVSTWVSTV